LTIAAAASGYRTFGASDDGLSFDVSIVDGTAWEIRTGCVYTHAGTSLARGTLEDSSTGSAITLTSAAVVTVTMSAGLGNQIEARLQSDPLLTIASSGASFAHTVTDPGVIDITLTNSCTLSFSGIPTGAWKIRLILRQGGIGNYTVSWPTGITWDGAGSEPSLRTAVGEYDDIELMSIDGGTTFIARNLRSVPAVSGGIVYDIVHIQNNGSTTQGLPAAVSTKIAAALTTVVANTDSWWDTANKYFKPTVAGKYLISVGVQGQATLSQITAQVWLNGTAIANGSAGAPAAYTTATGTFLVKMNGSTDTVEFKAYASATTTTNAAAANTFFMAFRLGD